jgi:hypothetical protein
MRSWQYASAVSDIAISSSVNKLCAFNGSSQLNGCGVACAAYPLDTTGRIAKDDCLATVRRSSGLYILDICVLQTRLAIRF